MGGLRQVAAGIVLSLSIAAPGFAQQPLKLRVADSFPNGHYIGEKVTKWWMAEVTRRTNGAVSFEYYPAEQLGKAKDLLSLTVSGVVDVGYVAPSFVTEKMPLSAIAELPLRFSESCQGTAAFTKIASDGGVLAEREFKPNGVKMLFAIVLPPYQAFFSKPRLQGLKSFDGLKVRSSGGAKEIVVRKLGAVPIQMATPEVYEALSRGTIDGTLFPFSSIYSYDLQGLVKQATVGENFGSFLITYMISNRRWATLPPEIQKVFNEVGQETSRLGCQVSQEGDGTDRDRLKAQGVELFSFNNADKQAIQAAMATVNTEWAQALDKRAKPGTAVLQAFEEALK